MLDLKRYGLEATWPRLRALQEEVANLEQRRGEAEGEVVAARAAILDAKEEDTEAAAKAIRAGKSVPKGSREAKAEARQADASRNLAAYTRAVGEAQGELAQFTSKHRDELREAILAALSEKAQLLAEYAKEATVLYSQLEDAKYDLREFAPPAPPSETGAPGSMRGHDVANVIAVRTAGWDGPPRGDVEATLRHLASLGARYPAPDTDTESGGEERGAA